MAKQNFAIEAVIRLNDKLTRPLRGTRRRINNMLQGIVKMTFRATKAMGRLGKSVAKVGMSFTKGAAVTAAAIGTGVVLLNKASAEAQLLAKSTGISLENLEAFTAAVKPAGFNLDNVNDLVEEMNNKFGEIDRTGVIPMQLQEALKGLKMDARELNKMDQGKRFLKIGNAIKKMGNEANAVSIADQIMGGEANKVFGVLRTYEGTLEEITAAHKKLNFQTDESREGALAFTTAFNGVASVIGTTAQLISGLLGTALKPLLEQFTEWAVVNKTLAQDNIAEWVTKAADAITKLVKAVSSWLEGGGLQRTFDDVKQFVTDFTEALIKLDKIITRVSTFLGVTEEEQTPAVIKRNASRARAESLMTQRFMPMGAFGASPSFSPQATSSPQERAVRTENTQNTVETQKMEIFVRGAVEKIVGGAPGVNFVTTGGFD